MHEKAVLHPMATLLPGALAYAERKGGISGRAFMVAVAVGVDVASNLGVAAREGLKFFRPATSGGFGATAAIGKWRIYRRSGQRTPLGGDWITDLGVVACLLPIGPL